MRKSILASASLLALSGMSGFAWAQDANEGEDDSVQDTVVVVGSFQKSLADAFDDKRFADQVLDAVSAEDIGKLPDISIAEAIARLPGVVANRDRGNATELSVRGLGPNLTNTLMNGRELATGENSRNVRYESYPGELLQGAYVFKSPKASMIEGGVGGTIDLRTVRPLDLGERRIVLNARASYSELANDVRDADALGYTGSISYVDQFMDDTLGVVFAYALREQPTASVSTTVFPSVPRSIFGNANTAAFDAAGVENLPYGFDMGVRGGTDSRNGVVSAVQWRPTSSFEANLDFFYSGVDFENPSRGVRIEGINSEFGNLYTDVQSADGFLTGGTVTQSADFGLSISNVNEIYTLYDDLYAGGLNLEWKSGNLTLIGDVGYSKNRREARFVSIETELHDLSGGSPVQLTSGPAVTFRTLGNGSTQFAFNYDLSDPSINLPVIVRVPDSDTIEDEIRAYKLDAKYDTGGAFFATLSAGVRYSDRRKSLFARTDFPFLNEADRVSVPASLLQTPLTGAGSVRFPPSLAFDLNGAVDQLFGGINPQQASFNTTESWIVDEDILSGYINADFQGSIGSLPFSGNLGVRVSKTEIVASSTFLENGVETGFVEVLTPFTIENDYTDVLPSLNVSFFPADRHIVRVGLSKAIARPPLDDMNAGVGEFNFGAPEAFGGNPKLEPFRANQLDLTYEWYKSDDTVFTISGFYKDIETFIVRQTQTGVELPSGAIGSFTQPVNGEGGSIKGVEIAYSQALKFLPGPFDGLGIYANYSHIDSNIEVGPAFVVGNFPLPGLAQNAFNAQLWYYKNGFETRLGYRYNDAYPTELGDVPGQVLYSDAAAVVDFQASYDFPETSPLNGLKLLFQANNLTDEPFKTYYATKNVRGRYEEFGRRFWLGFSYEF